MCRGGAVGQGHPRRANQGAGPRRPSPQLNLAWYGIVCHFARRGQRNAFEPTAQYGTVRGRAPAPPPPWHVTHRLPIATAHFFRPIPPSLFSQTLRCQNALLDLVILNTIIPLWARCLLSRLAQPDLPFISCVAAPSPVWPLYSRRFLSFLVLLSCPPPLPSRHGRHHCRR